MAGAVPAAASAAAASAAVPPPSAPLAPPSGPGVSSASPAQAIPDATPLGGASHSGGANFGSPTFSVGGNLHSSSRTAGPISTPPYVLGGAASAALPTGGGPPPLDNNFGSALSAAATLFQQARSVTRSDGVSLPPFTPTLGVPVSAVDSRGALFPQWAGVPRPQPILISSSAAAAAHDQYPTFSGDGAPPVQQSALRQFVDLLEAQQREAQGREFTRVPLAPQHDAAVRPQLYAGYYVAAFSADRVLGQRPLSVKEFLDQLAVAPSIVDAFWLMARDGMLRAAEGDLGAPLRIVTLMHVISLMSVSPPCPDWPSLRARLYSALYQQARGQVYDAVDAIFSQICLQPAGAPVLSASPASRGVQAQQRSGKARDSASSKRWCSHCSTGSHILSECWFADRSLATASNAKFVAWASKHPERAKSTFSFSPDAAADEDSNARKSTKPTKAS